MTSTKNDPLVRERTSAHRQSVVSEWRTLVGALVENLGTGLVALLAGVSVEQVSRWASGAAANPRAANERRVREAYRLYRELVVGDSPHTVRAWFIGGNPELGDASPAEALAADRFKEVFAAARSFLHG